MAKLTPAEVMEGICAIKTLHKLADKTENPGQVRRARAHHESLKRFAEDEGYGEIVAMGGDT